MFFIRNIENYHGLSVADLASLNLNLLVALDALLSERSVTRAGQKIGLAQSSMSHALASLRKTFDDPLLVRSASGMVPTTRAQELAEPLRRALEMLEAALEVPAAFDPSTASLRFVLACDAIQQVLLLPRVLDHLQRRAAGIVLHTEAPVAPQETYRRLGAGELDFALGRFEDPAANIHRRVLATDRVVYVARKGHPRIKRTLSKAAIRSERLLVQTPVTAGEAAPPARSGRQRRDRGPSVIATTPHVLASLFIVSQTDVITGTLERVAEMYKDLLGLRVFPAPAELPPVDTHIVWHDRGHHSAPQRWLLELLCELGGQG
jgi:DNA-binding transcriptional LysR family regulator